MVDINKKLEAISFFDKDEDFTHVYKKTEKLTTAIYMVTNLFSESEPMKWNLRKKSTNLLSFTIGYKDVFGTQHDDFVEQIKTKVLELISLLEVSSYSGLVSNMNFSIIKQEFINLLNHLSNLSSTSYKGSGVGVLPKSFFEIARTSSRSLEVVEDKNIFMSDSSLKDKLTLPSAHIFTRTNRQNIILGLLKKKKEVTIKDVAQVIKNCSEKTIQRELVTLITLGILKKTGERRWSKYSLISTT